jgi:hypothetical protein
MPLPQGNLPAARAFASYASRTVRLAPRGWLRSGVARDCRGCRHGPVRAVGPRFDPGGGHRGAVEETGGLTAVRCSCGAVLSGAMVLDRHQTRAAERGSHPASACRAFGLTRNRVTRAAGSVVVVAHVIADHRVGRACGALPLTSDCNCWVVSARAASTRHRVLRLQFRMRNTASDRRFRSLAAKAAVLFRGNVRVRRHRPVFGDRGAGRASGSGP